MDEGTARPICRQRQCRARRGGRQSDAHRRNWRFELLRFVAMYLILASHYFGLDNWQIRHRSRPCGAAGATRSMPSGCGRPGRCGSVHPDIGVLPRLLRLESPPAACPAVGAGVRLFRRDIRPLPFAAALLHHPMEIRPGRGRLSSLSPPGVLVRQRVFRPHAPRPVHQPVAGQSHLPPVAGPDGHRRLGGVHLQILDGRSRYWTEPLYMIAVYLIGALIRRYPDILPRIRWWMSRWYSSRPRH